MSNRHSNPEAFTDEQLVAYLDGEIDAVAARHLESCLADDDHLRNRLSELDRSWQLLDQLETDAAGRDFTRTTLEMVAAAEQVGQRAVAEPRTGRWRRATGVAALLLAAGMAGFLAVVAVRPDPNQQLLEDLPVLENLEPYLAVDSIAFLAALHEAGLFADEPPTENGSAEAGTSDGSALTISPEAARGRIEAMEPARKTQLRRRQQRFEALDRTEQARLRQLHNDLAAAPDPEALHAVALRYYDWLKALPPIARAELVELSPNARVEKVESILARQAVERIRRLDPEGARIFGAWLAGLTDRMIDALPEPVRARVRQEPDPQRRRALLFMSLQGPRSSDGFRHSIDQLLDASDLAELRAKLPEETRSELERHPVAEQWRIVRGWIPQLFWHRFGSRGSRGLFPEMEDRTLIEFFENDLDDVELDRLLALPAEEMQRELQQLYWQRSKGRPTPGFRRPGPRGPRPHPSGHHSTEDLPPRGSSPGRQP